MITTITNNCPQGWECPKCKTIWAPAIMACNCQTQKTQVSISTQPMPPGMQHAEQIYQQGDTVSPNHGMFIR